MKLNKIDPGQTYTIKELKETAELKIQIATLQDWCRIGKLKGKAKKVSKEYLILGQDFLNLFK